MTEKLEGCNFSDIKSLNLSEGVYAYEFNKSGKPVYVLWLSRNIDNLNHK